jgi:hypothetical protein
MVSMTSGGDLAMHTLVSAVFEPVEITGAPLCPWIMSRQLS